MISSPLSFVSPCLLLPCPSLLEAPFFLSVLTLLARNIIRRPHLAVKWVGKCSLYSMRLCAHLWKKRSPILMDKGSMITEGQLAVFISILHHFPGPHLFLCLVTVKILKLVTMSLDSSLALCLKQPTVISLLETWYPVQAIAVVNHFEAAFLMEVYLCHICKVMLVK